MTARELLEAAIEQEEISLVYCLVYLFRTGLIQENDTDIDFSLVDNQEVGKLIEENQLGIRKIRIFSLKRNRKRYEFIFAEKEEEAAARFRELFHTEPLNIHEYPLDFEMLEGKRVTSFREMRKRFNTFPAYLGYYEKQYGVIINGTNKNPQQKK